MATNIANLAGSSFQAGTKTPQDVHVVDANGDAVSFGGSGGTSSTDGAAFNNDTTVGTPIMGAYQTVVDAMTDGDLGVIAIDGDRNVKVNVVAGGTAGTQYTDGDTDTTPTGNALILKGAAGALTAATGEGTNGMDVDVTRVIPGTAATALGKAEDAAHGSGDVGVMALAVRADTAATVAGTDGDYTPLLVDASGRLHTHVGAVRGAPTLAVNQVSVTTTATEIVAARTGRRAVGVVNHGSTAFYVGPTSGVTTSNGVLVPGTVGASAVFDYAGAVYGIVGSGSVTVGYAEEY